MAKLVLNVVFALFLMLPGTTSENIVYNGGFDTGDFTGWILSGNPIPGNVDGSQPYSGADAANLFAAGSPAYMEQSLATTPGKLYELSYFLESDGGSPNEFSAEVAGIKLFEQRNIPKQSYTHYQFRFRARASSTQLKFGFLNDPGYFHLDSVSVTAVSPSDSASLGTAFKHSSKEVL